MSTKNFSIYLCLLALTFSGCPKQKHLQPSISPQETFDQALKDKMAKRFSKAIDRFTYLIFNFPGSVQASDAQFHIADCYFEMKDYEQAQAEFDFYLKNFPNGRYQEEARFKIALATFRSAPSPHKDQNKLLQAKELLINFLEDYPDSRFSPEGKELLAEIDTRLVQRELSAARLYFKAGEYKSALVYYEFIIGKYPQIQLSEIDRFFFAVCYAETGQPDKARPLLEEVMSRTNSHRLKQRAQQYLTRLH